MANEFENKFAVVTGGTRGIGRSIVEGLAQRGAHVLALFARDRTEAESLESWAKEKGLKVETLRGDLTQEDHFKVVVSAIQKTASERFGGRLDFLVHAAASGVHREAVALSSRHMHWTFEINFFVAHNLVRELSPLMGEGSRIVGLTSGGGQRVLPHYAAVGASKGALESLFRHYAVELAPRGIAVNCICPGMILTDAVDAFPEKEERIQRSIRETPTGRLTTTQEVAEVVSFLCGRFASQIIGQTLVIDGGRLLPN